MCAVGAHLVTVSPQEDADAAVTVSRVLRGELAHPRPDWRVLLRQPRLVAQRRAGHLDQRARPPARQAALPRVLDLLPSTARAHHFFAAISFITSISRSRSATMRLSRPFSASRAFSRFASVTSIAPKRFRHVYRVPSLTPCFLATSASGVLSASRRIFTICSSVNLLLRIAPPGWRACSQVSTGPKTARQVRLISARTNTVFRR